MTAKEPGAGAGEQPPTFETAIQHVINHFSREQESNTPDFILAQFLVRCLAAWNEATKRRQEWYGTSPEPPLPASAQTSGPEYGTVREVQPGDEQVSVVTGILRQALEDEKAKEYQRGLEDGARGMRERLVSKLEDEGWIPRDGTNAAMLRALPTVPPTEEPK